MIDTLSEILGHSSGIAEGACDVRVAAPSEVQPHSDEATQFQTLHRLRHVGMLNTPVQSMHYNSKWLRAFRCRIK